MLADKPAKEKPETLSKSPLCVAGAQDVDHLALLFLGILAGDGSQLEQPELKTVLISDSSITSIGLSPCARTLFFISE